MGIPVGVAELVADQFVGGGLVRDAQQGLGHAHQQHAFLGAQVVFAHEGLDHRRVGGAQAGAFHQGHGLSLHGRGIGRADGGLGQQFVDVFGLVAQIRGGDALHQFRPSGRQFGGDDRVHGGVRKAEDCQF